MDLIIQLETLETLEKYNYPNDKEAMEDLVVNKEMLEDTYEDGCVVGYGYTTVEELDEKTKEKEIMELLKVFSTFGCIVDFEEKTIIFTKEFCEKYIEMRLNMLKEKVSNISIEDFSKIDFNKEIDMFKENIPLALVNVTSESLQFCQENILSLCRMNFNNYNKKFNKEVNTSTFKIIEVFRGY